MNKIKELEYDRIKVKNNLVITAKYYLENLEKRFPYDILRCFLIFDVI